MNLQDIQELMQLGDNTKTKAAFETHCIVKSIEEVFKQYNPEDHVINDKVLRPDKKIMEDEKVVDTVYVSRLALPIQKKIVLLAASFLGKPELVCSPADTGQETVLAAIKKLWDDNKLDYSFRSIAKTTMSQYHAAELWFAKDVDPAFWEGTGISGKYKMSMKILSECRGDKLYPAFDEFGDMVAFGRGYKVKDQAGKEVEHFDVYTAENLYYSKFEDSKWLWMGTDKQYTEGFKQIPNVLKKIPVVYYHQPLVEWHDVQPLIERLETIISNHADTNDYSGSPILVGVGEVKSMSQKGEQGKFVELDNGADLKYLTYDNAPESIKMEVDNLLKFIYTFTHTPDISFEQMKGLGVFSGVALKMLFLDAHLKAADKEEIFGAGVQRRINLLKVAIGTIDESTKKSLVLNIKPKFNYFLPPNIVEEISNLTSALTAGIISKDTAISLNPLLSDPKAEAEKIKQQQTTPVA